MANLQQPPGVRVITVAVVRDRTEALGIKAKLKSQGIECDLMAERSFAATKATERKSGAFKIQVARPDVQRSLSILAANRSAAAANSPNGVSSRPSRAISLLRDPVKVPALSVIALAFVLCAALVLVFF